jgi:8-oxo-dGTP pyrophosphatase MutT (NUDIX family)
MMQQIWPAIALARACSGPARIPFVLMNARGPVLGSVAIAHLDALRAWPDAFEQLASADGPPRALVLRLGAGERDARLAQIHARLRADGLIVAWRDEPYPLRDRAGGEHGIIERAASRFWGTLTLGAHCNGYVADPSARPTHLWIARRSITKPTDPGRLDNLIGGGVPAGQSPREAVIREGWEEAGLEPHQMAGLVTGGLIDLECDIPEGRQHERLHVFDLELPPGLAPRNRDGEVAEHRLMTIADALACAAAGELTTDAALATLDFAVRRRLFEPDPGGREPTGAGAALTPAQRDAFDALRPINGRPSSGLGSRTTIQSN